MKFIDLFSGIGGFRKGMEMAGHECVGFCEIDKYAYMSYVSMHCITEKQRQYLQTLPMKQRQEEILKDEYRNGEWYAPDISKVSAAELPGCDCWCWGFPCTDISIAGKREGLRGSRSGLFYRVIYLLEQLSEEERPAYLLIENVKNLLSVNGGWDFTRVLSELDRCGYNAEWEVLDSQYFGVPQHRERIFIVGHLRGRSTTEIFPVAGNSRTIPQKYGAKQEVAEVFKHTSGLRYGSIEDAYIMDKDVDAVPSLRARYYKGASSHGDSLVIVHGKD